MTDETEIVEPDRAPGAPHPRQTTELFGQGEAEQAFLKAHQLGRLHHAWLLTGPRGVGKATLAWRMARHLVAHPKPPEQGLFGDAPQSLDMATEDPVFRRVAALGEPAIALCRRAWDEKAKRLKTRLGVDEVRALKRHFELSATDGGWRVAIIDTADEMTTEAANALLKLLEEPPARAILILVCHQPGRLLPTIRSRCRTLRLNALSEEDMGRALVAAGQPLDDLPVLHALTGGSAGEAVRFIDSGGTALYPEILSLLIDVPGFDRQDLARLAAGAAGRVNAGTYEMITELCLLALGRIARAGAGGRAALLEAERPVVARLCPSEGAARVWAELVGEIRARVAHARAVNLDPELVILDMFFSIEKTAARLS